MKYTIEIDTEKPTILAKEVLVFPKEKVIEVLNYITCATSIIINEQKQENEQLKKKVSYLEDNLRVARKNREDLQDTLANEIKDFIKEKPHTSLKLLANKELKEENKQLKENIKNARKKLFNILSEYEIGNYDSNTHQFYEDVCNVYNELMELAE
jgi:exonuclease VII large subunit